MPNGSTLSTFGSVALLVCGGSAMAAQATTQIAQDTMVQRSDTDHASIAPVPPENSVDTERPSVITLPEWIRKPSGAEFSAVYPDRAERQGVSGHATIACGITPQGTLQTCRVLGERPAEFGFGSAALKLAKYFHMRPVARDGKPVGGAVVTIPLHFGINR